ncbi:uncharacterized protein LOC107046182 [Diachasma alloeum]|uniref:uncharacterized protein LOC107046182 n=1 Tax=Diachasma alloeum TaxID=454923 RepID=UPI00073814F6|nr:uncharacterized protein LOC107046182 [Diachasma alloeum]XP_015124201.1 uncharacterized protein LOC107046182 [Diachasma alloeum]
MFTLLIWNYWYLWAGIIAGLILAAICGCWLWQGRKTISCSNGSTSSSDRRYSSAACYPPPHHYSRCSSFIQTLPPPYNEVTAKPDLYPLVIGFGDEGMGKGPSSFVMRYFRTLSHTSTLDSLSSSFMCNVVNEANTIIPPPYSIDSCNNSIDELSTMECERGQIADAGSFVSLANNQTTSDISSLAAQSPCSPPRATSPTIELRELLDKIQQLPSHDSSINRINYQNRPQALNFLGIQSPIQDFYSPGDYINSRLRRTRGKTYMPLGHHQMTTRNNKPKRWLSRSAPTTPSGTMPMAFIPGVHNPLRPSDTHNYNHRQQVIPLLSEQDENSVAQSAAGSQFTEHDEQLQQL